MREGDGRGQRAPVERGSSPLIRRKDLSLSICPPLQPEWNLLCPKTKKSLLLDSKLSHSFIRNNDRKHECVGACVTMEYHSKKGSLSKMVYFIFKYFLCLCVVFSGKGKKML